VPDPLERVTNLLALLLEARAPMTLAEIATQLAGQYPDGDTSRRAAFERDKALLRGEGVPIEQQVLSGDQAGQTAYWIDRKRYELAGLDLTPDERAALQLAVATVRLGTAWGAEALWKLGGDEAVEAPHDVSASLPSLESLPVLFAASTARATVSFDYRGRRREVDPYALVSREGFWYVVGHDRGAAAMRTFRVDRIDGAVAAGPPGAFERPTDFDVAKVFPDDPKLLGDGAAGEHPTAQVRVDSARALAVEHELGESSVVARGDDGSVTFEVPCRNELAFRSWVLGLLEHAEVVSPRSVRAAMADWLTDLAAGTDR
jgi:predicted DNA-binding transcriptional regulator YafY